MRDEQNPVYGNPNIEECFRVALKWNAWGNSLVWSFDGDGWTSNLVGISADETGWDTEFGKWYVAKTVIDPPAIV